MNLMDRFASKMPTTAQASVTGIATGLMASDWRAGLAGAAINAAPHVAHACYAVLEAKVMPSLDIFRYDRNTVELARRQGFRCGLAAIALAGLFMMTRDDVSSTNEQQEKKPKFEMAFPLG